MIINDTIMTEQHISRATINKMIGVLHESLKNDFNLARDLMQFLQDRNIDIPTLSKEELSELIPVSFNNKNSNEQIDKLKNSFEDIQKGEHIL